MSETWCPYCEEDIESWLFDNSHGVARFFGKCPNCGHPLRVDVELEPVFTIHKDQPHD